MNLQPDSIIKIEYSSMHDRPEMRLHGRLLLIARISWIVLALFIVTLNAIMIPRFNALLQANCQAGPQCFAIELTAYDRQFMHQFGLSLSSVAMYKVILDTGSVLVCCALGGLIFWRRSSDRMALFCAFMLVLFGGAGYTSILQDTLAPLSAAWLVLVNILDLFGQSSFMIFFFLFPSGQFVPRWTRWIAACVVLYWISTLLFTNGQGLWSNLVFGTLLLCVVGTQVYRYLYVSTSRERQQTKWVVFGLSIGIAGFLLVLILINIFPHAHSSILETLVGSTFIYGFLLLIPISIAVAILRSRLYDIDVIINKALVYGLLTVLLAAVYAGLIIGLESLFGLISRQGAQPPVIVVSTITIYTLFQPLRGRIQHVIDRRFYRRKYDAARTLAQFNATLRNEVDLATLSEQLLDVVEETMQPAHISLWLRKKGESS